ncbi:MAG: ABC transporter permease, partial [Spirulinaceae cyanobacterium]
MTTTPATSFQDRLDGVKAFLTNETFLYIIKRLLQGLFTLFLVSALSFTIIQLA